MERLRRLIQHREHLFRMAGLFGIGILAFVVLGAILVPRDFGVYGHYRAGALADNRLPPPAFAGRVACADCHTDVPEAQKGSRHAAVPCEACHGALARHAAEPEFQKPVKVSEPASCLVCHAANVAKPKGFKQIEPKEHFDGGACRECHAAHTPEKGPAQ